MIEIPPQDLTSPEEQEDHKQVLLVFQVPIDEQADHKLQMMNRSQTQRSHRLRGR
ncbi:hypothetical protein ZOSMA_29G00030 [Zostera marina]|uniref:Uncharacterized protein n=1 Tax=Zostera marina TaxID=29655 RepID=A0A0K9PDQ4_ZOSMR|nr:hypothetical protein ZOSMA_29G00030 [Zostera marina]